MSVPNVYISYSRNEIEWTSKFAEALQGRGIDVWLDLWSLPAGVSWNEWIDRTDAALRKADLFIAVLPLREPIDPSILVDLGFGFQMGKPIISICSIAGDAARLPMSDLMSDAARLSLVPPSVLSISRGTPEATAEVVASTVARQVGPARQPALTP